MAARQVLDQLGQKFQADQGRLQRVLRELARPAQQVVEESVLDLDVTVDECARERVLVLEVVTEAALGDPGICHDLVDRRRLEPFCQDCILGNVENPRARFGPSRHR